MKPITKLLRQALPLLCGFLLVSLEILLISNFINAFIPLILSFLLGLLLGTFIYFVKKDFTGNSCITLVAATLPTLVFIGLFAFYPNNKFDYIIVCFILINWLSLNLPCYISRLLSHKSSSSNFKSYSKQVSLLLVFSYLVLLGFLLFSDAFDYRAGLRSVNLIPFKTISRYITGNIYFSLRILAVNLLGNILLFIPLGFYLKAFIRKRWLTFLAIIVVPIMIEITQYLLASGVSDLDDVILNVLGALLGYLLLHLLDIIYHKFNINPDSSFLGF